MVEINSVISVNIISVNGPNDLVKKTKIILKQPVFIMKNFKYTEKWEE